MKNPIAKFYEYLARPLMPGGRILLALLCIPLACAMVRPLWRISMEAPQYPRGLWVEIDASGLRSGDDGQDLVEINTLNHYIGMKPLTEDRIPDLGWMPFALGALILLTLRVAAIGEVRSLVDLNVVITYVLGFFAFRFLYMLYAYGHELDPHAPFATEPFWPVIIGTKQIANFTTHGAPLAGTYALLAYALGVMAALVWHLVAGRRAALAAERANIEEPSPCPAE